MARKTEEKAWHERPFTTFTTLGRLLDLDPRSAEAFARKIKLEIVNTGKKDEITTKSVRDLLQRLEAPLDKLHRLQASGEVRGTWERDVECPSCRTFVACPSCGWNTTPEERARYKAPEPLPGADGVYRHGQALADAPHEPFGEDYNDVLEQDEEHERTAAMDRHTDAELWGK